VKDLGASVTTLKTGQQKLTKNVKTLKDNAATVAAAKAAEDNTAIPVVVSTPTAT
jgi:hypothetical protein